MEASLTCLSCMELMKEPTTCSPCGHTFCSGCLKAGIAEDGTMQPKCPECDDAVPGPVLKVGILGTLVPNFQFQQQALKSLQVGAATANAVSKFAMFGKKK